jgi:hypothetical protein
MLFNPIIDIIRHEPGSSPTAGRPTPVNGRAASPGCRGASGVIINRSILSHLFARHLALDFS